MTNLAAAVGVAAVAAAPAASLASQWPPTAAGNLLLLFARLPGQQWAFLVALGRPDFAGAASTGFGSRKSLAAAACWWLASDEPAEHLFAWNCRFEVASAASKSWPHCRLTRRR